MKYLIILSLMLTACEPKQQICKPACIKKEKRMVTICSKSAGATLIGGVTGFLVAGPLGAVLGGAGGHTVSDSSCYTEEQEYCKGYKRKCVQNPEWTTWAKENY